MMPAFAYRAVDASGRRQKGMEEASGPQEASRALERRGLLVLDVAELAGERRVRNGKGRRRGLLEATRALASLLAAGLPLARSLEVAEGVVSGILAASLAEVRGRVRRGAPLHAALAEHPVIFPPLYVGVVRAGERAGNLAGAFERLEAQLERDQALRSRLLSAAIYPLILAVVGGVAVVLLALFVLPRFAELLMDAGRPRRAAGPVGRFTV